MQFIFDVAKIKWEKNNKIVSVKMEFLQVQQKQQHVVSEY